MNSKDNSGPNMTWKGRYSQYILQGMRQNNFFFRKETKMGKVCCSITILLLVATCGMAQCKVALKQISDTYEGGCKKGKAHGTGLAKGADMYNGEFSKGFPNGKGIYTWANGNIYEGGFKKGKKEGQGKMVVKKSGEVIEGYWKLDQYIGREKNPYKIIQKPSSILSASFRQKPGKDQLIVVFQKNGKVIQKDGLDLVALEGSFGNIISNKITQTVQQVSFPFTGRIKYDGQDFRFRITQRGSWNIKINIR